MIVNDYWAKKLLLSQGQITVKPPHSAGISKHGWKKVCVGDVVMFTSKHGVIAAHIRICPSHQPKRMIPNTVSCRCLLVNTPSIPHSSVDGFTRILPGVSVVFISLIVQRISRFLFTINTVFPSGPLYRVDYSIPLLYHQYRFRPPMKGSYSTT